jgi:hypothetical protein
MSTIIKVLQLILRNLPMQKLACPKLIVSVAESWSRMAQICYLNLKWSAVHDDTVLEDSSLDIDIHIERDT